MRAQVPPGEIFHELGNGVSYRFTRALGAPNPKDFAGSRYTYQLDVTGINNGLQH